LLIIFFINPSSFKKTPMKNITLLILWTSIFLTSCQNSNPEKVTFVASEEFKKTNLPFSEAVIVGNTIYLSGQVGSLPHDAMTLAEGGIKAEARQALENIKELLERNGASMDDVVKCTVMLADISEWGDFNGEYIKFFPGDKPARSAFGTSGLALGARVEIECIAILK